jgi:hypothetical protein
MDEGGSGRGKSPPRACMCLVLRLLAAIVLYKKPLMARPSLVESSPSSMMSHSLWVRGGTVAETPPPTHGSAVLGR